MVQPDGSVIWIQVHGDEWFNYVTNEKGQVIAKDADGFYRLAQMPTAKQREEAKSMRRAAAQMREQARAQAQASSLTHGRHRIPVVLVNFSDNEFTLKDPVTAFSNMLNQVGYSKNGGTGSVRDYYYDNSHGEYEPVFEVFGPVTLSNPSEYYAGDNGMERGRDAIKEACGLIDEEVDFTQYDSDLDGSIDMILMYYAGHNQAEGGGETTIWPHQGYSYGRFDGKKLGRFFCTSELKGAYGTTMCGIGTTCHEFGHSLGLPDFYDTDNEHGDAGALYSYSIMCSGSYNNRGCTPPYMNSEELMLLGWLDGQTEISAQGTVTIRPIQEYVAYKTPTTMDGEYFVYECRTQTGWDKYLPGSGMLVYHVDKADRESLNPDDMYAEWYTPINLWQYWESTNAINTFGSHPCFYLIPAASPTNLNYSGPEANIPFPGNKNVKKYTPVDWQDEQGDFYFSDIAFDGTQVTMTATLTSPVGVQGVIRNTSAKPVRGATVSIFRKGAASAPARNGAQRRSPAQESALFSVTTDIDGVYSIEDASLADGTFTLVVGCDGYIEMETTVEIGRRIETRDLYLRKVGESTENTFLMYNPEGSTFVGYGYGNTSTAIAAGIHLSAEEMAPFVGKQIKLISFQPSGDESTTVEAAYVFIEVGSVRKFTQKVDNVRFDGMNTVNIVSREFYVPAGSDLYIGYSLVGCNEPYPLLVQACEEDKAGYFAKFNSSRANSWSLMQGDNGTFYTPVLSASVGEPAEPELGFNYIANPKNGLYKVGDQFELALVRYDDDAPSTVTWKFDGKTVQDASVKLKAGSHTVEANLTYPDGSREVIRLVISAE